jgi:hypothetical protein
MRKPHALAVSCLFAATAVTGATAAMKTVHLGTATVKAVPVPAGIVASRSAKLDGWAASLRRARASRPPKLPAVPVFPYVPIPTMPAPTLEVAQRVVAAQQPAAPTPAVTTIQASPVVEPAPATASESSGEHEDHHQGDDVHDEHDDHGD